MKTTQEVCEISGCNCLAEFINLQDNMLCYSCVEKEIEENAEDPELASSWDDYEDLQSYFNAIRKAKA